MYCRVLAGAVCGMEVVPVQVEADVSDGMPQFTMVGDVSVQVREAQDRVRTALRNIGVILPPKRITVNLSPADFRKEGTRFDLPIAAAVLTALGRLPEGALEGTMVIGELGLDGCVKGVPGILPSVAVARELGCKSCIVPGENAAEGRRVREIAVVGVNQLRELMLYCCLGEKPVETSGEAEQRAEEEIPDFADLTGQEGGKRAAMIAAAGFHNLLMLGPPGSGKTMIARRIPGILPELTEEESLEISRIYSIAGLLGKERPLMRTRPFRAPHHTISAQALAGGGRSPRPGEVTLAHRGVLFMDELPETARGTLEILRQPLEEKRIIISRVRGTYEFPAAFLLVAAMNPCPCGYYPDMNRCTCSAGDISRYLGRISQPLLDRIDLCVRVEPASYEELEGCGRETMDSAAMRVLVNRARACQEERYRGQKLRFNSELSGTELRRYCALTKEARRLLEQAYRGLELSARGYHGVIRTARTIADLEGADLIDSAQIGEAICIRSADKRIWRV